MLRRLPRSTRTDTLFPAATRFRARDMVLTRRIDTEATALQRHGELGFWAQLLGQEAAQIGAGRALRPQDYVFPTYREHGVRSEEHTSELQSLMRMLYAVFCLKKKTHNSELPRPQLQIHTHSK